MYSVKNTTHTVFAFTLIALSAVVVASGNFVGIALGTVGGGILVAERLGIEFIYVSYGLIAIGGLFVIIQALPNPSILPVIIGMLMIVLSGREVLHLSTDEDSFTSSTASDR